MAEAKLFKVGGSQAVRLPKEFRFEGDRVHIRREGRRVILEPHEPDRPRTLEEVRAWLKSIQMDVGSDFMAEGRQQPPPQERDWPDDG